MLIMAPNFECESLLPFHRGRLRYSAYSHGWFAGNENVSLSFICTTSILDFFSFFFLSMMSDVLRNSLRVIDVRRLGGHNHAGRVADSHHKVLATEI